MSVNQKEKELVAVGASIAAGCLPCTDYHARAVRQAGATEEEARRAAAIGLAVKHESLALMGSRAAEHFGRREEWPTLPSTDGPATSTSSVRGLSETNGLALSQAEGLTPLAVLIAIASATAAQCVPALERYVVAARQQGLDEADVKRAVGIGRAMREQAARQVDQAANAAGEVSPASPCCEEPATAPSPTPQAAPCGCQA